MSSGNENGQRDDAYGPPQRYGQRSEFKVTPPGLAMTINTTEHPHQRSGGCGRAVGTSGVASWVL